MRRGQELLGVTEIHTLRLLRNEYNLHIPVAILFFAVRSDNKSLVKKMPIRQNRNGRFNFFLKCFLWNERERESERKKEK